MSSSAGERKSVKRAISRFIPITTWLSESSPRADIVAGIASGWTACARGNGIRGDCRSTAANGFVRRHGGDVCLCDLWHLPPTSGHFHFFFCGHAGSPGDSYCPGRFGTLRDTGNRHHDRGRLYLSCGRPAQIGFGLGVHLQTRSQRLCLWPGAHHHGETRTQADGDPRGPGQFLSPGMACVRPRCPR